MSNHGPSNSDPNQAIRLEDNPAPIMASPGGRFVTSPRSGTRKFEVPVTATSTNQDDALIPKKRRKCYIL
jgi:hypothetical protein